MHRGLELGLVATSVTSVANGPLLTETKCFVRPRSGLKLSCVGFHYRTSIARARHDSCCSTPVSPHSAYPWHGCGPTSSA